MRRWVGNKERATRRMHAAGPGAARLGEVWAAADCLDAEVASQCPLAFEAGSLLRDDFFAL